MAENIMGPIPPGEGETKGRTPWYPNPRDTTKDWNYIYLRTLWEDHPAVWYAADERYRDAMHNINESLEPDLDSLLALAIREQKKEDELLREVFNEYGDGARTDGERIRAFNKLYQMKEVFSRNLTKIEQLHAGLTKQGRIDITANFRTYLNDAIKALLKDNPATISEDTLMAITKDALVRAFSSVDDRTKPREEWTHSYQELAYLVESMGDNDPFIQQVYNIYFKTAFDKLEEERKKSGERRKKTKDPSFIGSLITKARGAHGNLLEVVGALVADTLAESGGKGKVIHSGGSGQKTDYMQLYGATFDIPTDLLEVAPQGESVRANFIEKYRKFYDKIAGQSGYIVEVSAKNYDLNYEKFREQGFSAQSNITIENLQKMLRAYKYNEQNIRELVFALTNIGPDTIAGMSDNVAHSLSLLIGYFLFDDIGLDFQAETEGPRAVHLFNLDGIYVPLSSFLFAAYESLRDLEGMVQQNMVSVRYEPEDIGYEKAGKGELDKKRWQETVAIKQKQPALSVHFFRDFPEYVVSRLSK